MKNFKQIILFYLFLIFFVVSATSFAQEKTYQFPELHGPYLGQKLPGDTPELFAPNIISTGIYERDFTMTADGKEIFFGIFMGDIVTIFETKQIDGQWSEPQVASFARNFDYKYFEPAITPDGQRIFFCCTRPREGEKPLPGYGHQHIWAADRNTDGSWGDIYCLPAEINSDQKEYFPSVTKNGTMYFTRNYQGNRNTEIFRAKFIGGKYIKAERLPDVINKDKNIYNAFIDPDEKYLLACLTKRDDSVTPGKPNYYVFFRNDDDSWSEPVNLGETINFPGCGAIAQSLSPDGKYLFFASTKSDFSSEKPITYQWMKQKEKTPQNGNSDIYWVDSGFIHKLKK